MRLRWKRTNRYSRDQTSEQRLGKQTGLTYLLVLLLVAAAGIGLAATGELWRWERRRSQENEFFYVGERYRQAIAWYYWSSAGALRRYPSTLDELLADPRFAAPRRYLRKRYVDPLTGQDWQVILAPGGGIMGVYSASSEQPITDSYGATRYQDIQFVFQPDAAPAVSG